MISKQSLRRYYPDQVWKYIPGYHLSHCSVAPHCSAKVRFFGGKRKDFGFLFTGYDHDYKESLK